MAANSQDILTRLAANFTTDQGGGSREKPDLVTRDIGGQFRKNQPYISGYFQIIFALPVDVGTTKGVFGNNGDIPAKWLTSTVEGFTPHTQNLNKADVMGQGQVGASFVTSITTTREFTCTFREYQHMPILQTIRQWTSVFDPYTGVSPLEGSDFIPSAYKGAACIIQTKPVKSNAKEIAAHDIEELYIYQGVFPTNIPVDTAAASDITGNDTVQLSATFSFDGAPLTSAEVSKDEVAKWFSDMKAFDTYANHTKNIPFGSK